jgi:2-haloacid dehalogenase
MPATFPQALVFDVFGTVVDWRGSIAAEGARLARAWGLTPPIDWAAFADAWRGRYRYIFPAPGQRFRALTHSRCT